MVGMSGCTMLSTCTDHHWTPFMCCISIFIRGETSFGQLVVRPDSGDPEETCVAISGPVVSAGHQAVRYAGDLRSFQAEVAILKILLEQFADEVTETKPGAQKQKYAATRMRNMEAAKEYLGLLGRHM